MKKIRSLKIYVEKKVKALQDAGYHAEWVNGCETRLGECGCSDPNCCKQHRSIEEQERWATIITNASGNKANKIWVSLDLAKPFYGK